MNLKIPDFSFIFMIIIRMSQVPQKNRQPDNDDKKEMMMLPDY